MVLYLCSNQNINLFDFLEGKGNEIPIKKMSGLFSLKQFVIHDVRNFKQFTYFVIDLKALKDTEDEIVEAISAFGSMYSSRVILFAEGLEGSSPLLSRLIDLKIYNIITSTGYDDIKEEMLLCISPEGKSLRSAIKSKYFMQDDIRAKDKGKYSFLCKDIKIAVVGVERRVGTTTIAFNLVSYLVSAGAEAAYVEANKHGHLATLPSFYKGMAAHEDFLEYQGVRYYFSGRFPGENNFIVIDFGALFECRTQALKQCDLVLVCGNAKPYEIEGVKLGLATISDIKPQLILSHVPSKDQEMIRSLLKVSKAPVHFYEYVPDLFDGISNSSLFLEILKDYISEAKDEKT